MDLRQMTDEELALRARTEPAPAFEVLFERYRTPLYNFLLRSDTKPSWRPLYARYLARSRRSANARFPSFCDIRVG